jgi:hypothetical protein
MRIGKVTGSLLALGLAFMLTVAVLRAAVRCARSMWHCLGLDNLEC